MAAHNFSYIFIIVFVWSIASHLCWCDFEGSSFISKTFFMWQLKKPEWASHLLIWTFHILFIYNTFLRLSIGRICCLLDIFFIVWVFIQVSAVNSNIFSRFSARDSNFLVPDIILLGATFSVEWFSILYSVNITIEILGMDWMFW